MSQIYFFNIRQGGANLFGPAGIPAPLNLGLSCQGGVPVTIDVQGVEGIPIGKVLRFEFSASGSLPEGGIGVLAGGTVDINQSTPSRYLFTPSQSVAVTLTGEVVEVDSKTENPIVSKSFSGFSGRNRRSSSRRKRRF